MRRRLGLSLVLLLGALVMAGSSVGAGTRVAKRCGLGTVRGIAYVTGDPKKGIANLPGDFSSEAILFGYRWNCSGGAVSVRQSAGTPGIDVRFAGNPGQFAVGNTISATGAASITRNPDGSFHVAIVASTSSGFAARTDVSFVIIVF
jgi:hypothetical protein